MSLKYVKPEEVTVGDVLIFQNDVVEAPYKCLVRVKKISTVAELTSEGEVSLLPDDELIANVEILGALEPMAQLCPETGTKLTLYVRALAYPRQELRAGFASVQLLFRKDFVSSPEGVVLPHSFKRCTGHLFLMGLSDIEHPEQLQEVFEKYFNKVNNLLGTDLALLLDETRDSLRLVSLPTVLGNSLKGHLDVMTDPVALKKRGKNVHFVVQAQRAFIPGEQIFVNCFLELGSGNTLFEKGKLLAEFMALLFLVYQEAQE